MIKNFTMILFLITQLLLQIFSEAIIAQEQISWKTLPNSPVASFRHDDAWFVSAKTGWITNGTGQVFRTTDGGDSWELQLNRPFVWFRSIVFVDSLRGWVGNLGPNCFAPGATDPTLIFHTDNGGQSWTPVLNIQRPSPSGICGMWAVNDSTVYGAGTICGNPGIIKTTDGGAFWSSVDLSSFCDRLVDCYFFSADSGFVVGGIGEPGSSRGVVLFTGDGGITWEEKHRTENSPVWCWKISFPTKNVGFVSLETPLETGVRRTFFLKTLDRGNTWEEKPFLDNNTLYWEQGMGFATPNTGWIGGDNDTYETTDGGDTWQITENAVNLNRVRMVNDTLGYAVGERVYKYTRKIPVGVESSENYLPEGYELAQNFPNPFNPTTSLSYTIPRAEHVSLLIYNVAGQEVAHLINKTQPAGSHVVEFDAGNLPSGVYLYRLLTEHFSDTRKMMVLK